MGGGLDNIDLSFEIVKVPISTMLPDPFQPRDKCDYDELVPLIHSLATAGQKTYPLTEFVRGDVYLKYIAPLKKKDFDILARGVDPNKMCNFLVVGHRRTIAAKEAGYKAMHVKRLKNRLTTLERILVQLDEDSQVPLTPWAAARQTARHYSAENEKSTLEGLGPLSVREFALKCREGEKTVRDRLAYVNNLSDKVKLLVEETKKLDFSKAILISRIRDEQKQERVAVKHGTEDYDELRKIVLAIANKGVGVFDMCIQTNGCHTFPEYRESVRDFEKQVYKALRLCAMDRNYSGAIQKQKLGKKMRDVRLAVSSLVSKLSEADDTMQRLKKLGSNGDRRHAEDLISMIQKSGSKSVSPLKNHSMPKIRYIPISKIDPDPNNPREKVTEKELDSLAWSIIREGLLNPVLAEIGKDGRYDLVAGERRYRASKMVEDWSYGFAALFSLLTFSKLAPRKDFKIPVIPLQNLPKLTKLQLQIFENTQVPFSETERAYGLGRAIDEMKKEGRENIKEEIDYLIQTLHISRQTGLRALRYQRQTDNKLKKLVEDGLLSYSAACSLMAFPKDEQIDLAYRAVLFDYDSAKLSEARERVIAERTQISLFGDDKSKKGVNYDMLASKFSEVLHNLNFTIDKVANTPEAIKYLSGETHFVKSMIKLEKTVNKFYDSCCKKRKALK